MMGLREQDGADFERSAELRWCDRFSGAHLRMRRVERVNA
jgi:hypothetical protein